HLRAVRVEPYDVAHVVAPDRAILKEVAAAENTVAQTQTDELAREREQLLILLVQRPVVPGELVILTVGIVVALLGTAGFIAREQHRHALREHERRQEVADL